MARKRVAAVPAAWSCATASCGLQIVQICGSTTSEHFSGHSGFNVGTGKR